ncbi:hypothetical protein RJ639_046436, partial [Escallonia herrerae]
MALTENNHRKVVFLVMTAFRLHIVLDNAVAENLGELTGLPATGNIVNKCVSRATPTVAGDLLLVGIHGPLGPRPLSIITASGTFYIGLVHFSYGSSDTRTIFFATAFYVGVSSLVSNTTSSHMLHFPRQLGKARCSNRCNSVANITVANWGYAGAAIWGSSPAIDIAGGLVYSATGQLYPAPPEVLQYQAKQNNQTKTSGPDQCIGSDINFDSMLVFDTVSGNIRWSRQLGGYDAFNFAYPDCPPGPNLDEDVGEATMLLTISSNGKMRDIVVAVQKSGFSWDLDRENGAIVWFK